MLTPLPLLRQYLERIIAQRHAQGRRIDGLQVELSRLPDSYDAMTEFMQRLNRLEMRDDFPYEEPEDWEGIRAARRPDFPEGRIGAARTAAEKKARARSAFMASVAGCILGKPLEIDPTLDEIRAAAEAVGEWPLRDYVSLALLDALGRRHGSADTCCRDTIRFVAPDDDINYTLIGLQILERHGFAFTRHNLARLWLEQLPIFMTFGPERKFLADAVVRVGNGRMPDETTIEIMRREWVVGEEACGAAIRVDAYGFACPGRPALAAELAWRDASMTHRFTGVYASMYIAAAIAAAPAVDDPLEIFDLAIACLPVNTRFAAAMRECFDLVSRADDWLAGYRAINARYGEYRHCQLYQECGQLINTARFAPDVESAIAMQVMQGCDTDCFGKIAGAIMGGFFPPDTLPERWIAPFNDDLQTGLGQFAERSLSAAADRVARLAVME